MLTIEKPDLNRIDIRLHGPIDADQMRAGMDALIGAAEGVRDGLMLYTVDDFSWPTAGALAVELGYLPQLFSLVSKFRRCAVLSDTSWLRTAAEVEGALIPSIAIKAFERRHRAAAEAWLSEERAPV